MTRLLRLAVKSVVDVSALNFSYIMTQNLFAVVVLALSYYSHLKQNSIYKII